MKRLNVFKIILYIFLILTSITLAFGVQIIKYDWDWSVFQESEIWLSAFTSAYFFGTISITVLIFTYDVLAKDEKYTKPDNEIYQATPSLMNSTFEDAIDRHNWDKKKRAWYNKISSSITRHKRRRTRLIDEDLKYNKPDKYHPRTKRWLNRMNSLLDQRTKGWIDSNLPYTNINYEEISVNEILYGVEKPKTKRRELVRPLLSNILIKIVNPLFSTVLTVALAAFQFQDGKVEVIEILSWAGMMLLMVIINVLISIFGGISSHRRRLYNTSVRFGKIQSYRNGDYDKLESIPKVWELTESPQEHKIDDISPLNKEDDIPTIPDTNKEDNTI